MIDHLSETEKIDYILQGSKALSSARVLHLQSCSYCKMEIRQQISTDEHLRYLVPRKLNVNIYQQIESKLHKTPVLRKNDWFFTVTLVALIIIAFSFIFQKKGTPAFSNQKFITPLTEVLKHKVPETGINWKTTYDRSLQTITEFIIHAIGSNSYTRLSIAILFAIFFYMLIDHQVVKRRKT